MTPEQDRLYWREWGKLTKRCKAENWTVPQRHEFHRWCLAQCGCVGCKNRVGLPEPISHTLFDNHRFDKFLAGCAAYSGNLNAVLRRDAMPRTRLIHKITIEQVKLLSIVLSSKLKVQSSTSGELLRACEVVPNLEAAQSYVAELMSKRFGTEDVTQLRDQEEPVTGKSELEMLRDTLDARIAELRTKRVASTMGLDVKQFKRLTVAGQRRASAESGWNWHDVKRAAGVECDCAKCRESRESFRTGTAKGAKSGREAVAG